jgi:hypothetical protein
MMRSLFESAFRFTHPRTIMKTKLNLIRSAIGQIADLSGTTRLSSFKTGLFITVMSVSTATHAFDFGPDGIFSLNGFGEVTMGHRNNRCIDCQFLPATEGKQKFWADPLKPGVEYKAVSTVNYQVQPYLGVKYDLGRGFKVAGLVSKRWRDGVVDGKHVGDDRAGSREDVPGFWYEKNVALSHEDYGSVRIGHMTTRAWNVADFPYGTNLGLAEAWSSSGAGYGMLTNAVRFTSRSTEFIEGDLVLEVTYDRGNTDFKINKPRFVEMYAQFYRGPLVVDAMVQNARNGSPGAWGHSPFTGLTPFAADDSKMRSSSQGIAMLMARYQLNSQVEVSGGARYNRWSGANAVQLQVGDNVGTFDRFNNMFNVNWNGTLNGVPNPGYAASSVDVMVGGRYRMDKWVTSVGVVHLGTAATNNPSERGQSNSALIGVLGLQYDYGNGLKFNVQTGAVHYAIKGLSPLSMPGNASFTDVDSRVSRNGNWIAAGFVYGF